MKKHRHELIQKTILKYSKYLLKADTANYKDTAPYAILLSFQLGLRVGELIALKWSDISKGVIHIQRQEVIFDKYDDNLNLIAKSVQLFAGYEELETTLHSYYKDISDHELLLDICSCL